MVAVRSPAGGGACGRERGARTGGGSGLSAPGLGRAGRCASSGDGALGGAELRGDVADGGATGGEAVDDLVLLGWGEVVVGDVVAGEGAFHGDLVDVIWLGGLGGRCPRCGVGVNVVPGQRRQPAVWGGMGSGGVGDSALLTGRPRWADVPQPLVQGRHVVSGADGDRLACHAAVQAARAAAELGGQQLRSPAEGDERLQATAGSGAVDTAVWCPASVV